VKKIISLFASLALLVGITACGAGNSSNSGYGNYYDSICVNPITQFRVPDYECGAGYNPGWLYYVPYGYHSVGYGVHVLHYNHSLYSRPRNATIHIGGVSGKGGVAKHYSSGSVYTNKSGATTTRRPVSNTGPSRPSSQRSVSRTGNGNTTKRSGFGSGGSTRIGGTTRRR
jgi:hypothetical protein